RPMAGDEVHLAVQHPAPVLHSIAVELDLVSVGIEHVDAVRDLMVDGHQHLHIGSLRTLVRIDQFGLVLEFPSEVIEAWLEADAFGKQYEAVTSKARLAAGYLDHAEVVRCVASPEEGGLEARLPELDREPAGGVVERLRFLEILDPDVGVA